MEFEFCLKCETPLFVAGAQPSSPNVEIEGLRVPELRGALRFWLRAALANPNLSDLLKMESSVFGGTEIGRSMRISTHWSGERNSVIAFPRMNDATPHPEIKRIIKRQAIPSGTLFDVKIETYRHPSDNDRYLLSSLGLLCLLGGIGGRTRRCFGSMSLAGHPSNYQDLAKNRNWPALSSMQPITVAEESIEMIGNVVSSQLRDLLRVNCVSYDPSVVSKINYSALAKGVTRFYLIGIKTQNGGFKLWDDWESAMGPTDPKISTTVPSLQQDFYKDFKKLGKITSIGTVKPREASPIVIQIKPCIIKTPNGVERKFFGLLTLFTSSQLGKETEKLLDGFLLTPPKAIHVREVFPW